jgi:precorrin-4 methylase
MACMQKVQRMASDKEAIYDSAVQKMAEFARLEYPISVLRGVCTYMAATTAQYEWINVRATISMWT